MSIEKITRINSVTPTNAVSSVTNRSKNIQNQIQLKEQHLNRLSNDSKLSTQEKEQKRQELQKEIEELNRKLELMRQEQKEAEQKAEQKRQTEEAAKSELQKTETSKTEGSKTERLETEPSHTQAAQDKHTNSSSNTEHDKTQAKVSALKDAQQLLNSNRTLREYMIETSTDFDKQNRVRILRSEVKLDSLRGVQNKAKQEHLDDLTHKENFWIQTKYKQQNEHAEKTYKNLTTL